MLFHGEQALDIARGLDRNGFSQVYIVGRNADIDTGSEDIWDGQGTYTPFSVAGAIYISSSNNADNATATINYLDSNGAAQTVDKAIAGQTKTAVGVTASAINLSSLSAACAGDVYIYIDDTLTAGVPDTATKIRAKILAGNLQTYMGIYTVPTGYAAALVEYSGTHSGIQLWSVPAIGGTAVWKEALNGYRQCPRPIAVGEMIKFRYTATADNQDVMVSATLILKKI